MSRATRWFDESGDAPDSDNFSSVLVDSEVLEESPSCSRFQAKGASERAGGACK